jgi:D-amino peptidase
MSKKSKKVFITIDMEGISGIVDRTHTGVRDGPQEYEYGRKLMVGDLNAAIEGVLESGAEEIVVSDAHGRMRNLYPEDVHEAAHLIRGSPKPDLMMSGISGDFDASFYIGYHSMMGTPEAIICHTISSRVVDGLFINGRETEEFGLNAALAGWYGVPSVFISGDAAVAAEAKSFIPEINTAIVKWGVSRYAARCLHPKRARALIKRGARVALANAANVKPFKVEEPVKVKIRLASSTQAEFSSMLPFVETLDGRTIKATFSDYHEAHRGITAMIFFAGAIHTP